MKSLEEIAVKNPHFAHLFTVVLAQITHHALTIAKRSIARISILGQLLMNKVHVYCW